MLSLPRVPFQGHNIIFPELNMFSSYQYQVRPKVSEIDNLQVKAGFENTDWVLTGWQEQILGEVILPWALCLLFKTNWLKLSPVVSLTSS